MSNLQHLLGHYAEHPSVKEILRNLENTPDRVRIQIGGLTGAQESFAIASTALGQKTAAGALHVLVANAKEEAAYRHNDLEGIMGREAVYFFPDSFKRPAFFDDLNQTQILQRSETISKIAVPAGSASVVVTYPEALFEKVVKPEILQKSRIEVKKGNAWMLIL